MNCGRKKAASSSRASPPSQSPSQSPSLSQSPFCNFVGGIWPFIVIIIVIVIVIIVIVITIVIIIIIVIIVIVVVIIIIIVIIIIVVVIVIVVVSFLCSINCQLHFCWPCSINAAAAGPCSSTAAGQYSRFVDEFGGCCSKLQDEKKRSNRVVEAIGEGS